MSFWAKYLSRFYGILNERQVPRNWKRLENSAQSWKEHAKALAMMQRVFLKLGNSGDSRDCVKIGQALLDAGLERFTDGGFWIWDGKFTEDSVEYYSPKVPRSLGYRPEEWPYLASKWMQAIHPDDLKVAMRNHEKHVETRGEHEYFQPVRYYTKKGTLYRLFAPVRS